MLATELAALAQRVDGRAPDEARAVTMEAHSGLLHIRTPGSAIVMTHARGTVAPHPDRPGEGIFRIAVSGRKNDPLLHFLRGVFVKSGCVSLGAVSFGRRVESLAVDVHIVEADGNLWPLCVAGINAILDEYGVSRVFRPVCFHFAQVGPLLVTDPDAGELAAAAWSVHVAMRSTREAVLIEKRGGPCDPQAFLDAASRAFVALQGR